MGVDYFSKIGRWDEELGLFRCGVYRSLSVPYAFGGGTKRRLEPCWRLPFLLYILPSPGAQ